MKRAKASHVHARLAQLDEVAYDVLNLRRICHGPNDVLSDFRHGVEYYVKQNARVRASPAGSDSLPFPSPLLYIGGWETGNRG